MKHASWMVLAIICAAGASMATAAPLAAAPAVQRAKRAPTCAIGQLKIRVLEYQGALGTEHTILEFQSTAARRCSLFGYPGLVPLNSRGKRLGTKLTRGPGSSAATTTAKKTVTLKRDQSAYADLSSPDQGTRGLLKPAGILVTPPNDHRAARVSTRPVHGGGQMVICGKSQAISPVFAKLRNP